ncbi:hypothetical protein D9M71_664940 [compost metagenome]
MNRLAQGALGVSLEAAQQHRREFLRAIGACAEPRFTGATHVALEQGRGEVRVGVQALQGDTPGNQLALVVKANDAGREQVAQGIGEYPGLLTIPGRHEAVGGAQVNSYDHNLISFKDAVG